MLRYTGNTGKPLRSNSMQYQGQTDYDHQGPSPRRGVILCNLGTPDAPQTPELRRYLKEFLSDPRVVEVPRLIWWLILNGIILRIRPRRSAKLYRSVWSDEGSPLMVHSRAQWRECKKSSPKNTVMKYLWCWVCAMAIPRCNRPSTNSPR